LLKAHRLIVSQMNDVAGSDGKKLLLAVNGDK
jgi:hypothetical protein